MKATDIKVGKLYKVNWMDKEIIVKVESERDGHFSRIHICTYNDINAEKRKIGVFSEKFINEIKLTR